MFKKVGRLKPDDEHDTIRVIVDETGDIGCISRERMEALVAGISPVLDAGSEVGIEFRFGDAGYRVLAWQVRNMMEKWPGKKAAVFRESDT